MNISCAICDEIFTNSEEARITICGHIFHKICLNEWLKRSATCPQCRKTCLRKSIRRIYFNLNDDAEVDPDSLTTELNDLEINLSTMESEYSKLETENAILKSNQQNLEIEYTKLKTNYTKSQSFYAKSQEQLSKLQAENEKREKDYKDLERKYSKLESRHSKLNEKCLEYSEQLNTLDDLKLKYLKLEKQYTNLLKQYSNTEKNLIKCKSEINSLQVQQNSDMFDCNYNLTMENPGMNNMLMTIPSYRGRIRQFILNVQDKMKDMEENPSRLSFSGASVIFFFIHCSLTIWQKFKYSSK